MKNVRLRTIATLAVLLSSSRAEASFWDLYGFHPRAIGMANCQTAVADDFTAVFYNPAALTLAKSPGYALGFSTSRPSLSLEFERESQVAPVDPPSSSALSFGTHFPLGGEAARDRLTMALAFSIPTRSLLSGQAIDPSVPQWYQYQALPERIVFMLGLGVLPFDWLSLGMGIQVLAGLTGLLDYELDIVAGRFSRKTVTFDIEPRGAPVLGLELRPLEGLRIGASYRGAISTDVDLPVSLEITGLADLHVDTSFIVQYTPHELTAGVSYETGTGLLLSGELAVALWSNAPDPSPSSRIDAGGELLEGTGLASALDAPAPGQERAVDLAFRNVIIPRAAVEQRLGDVTLRAGYALKPSPAPVQTSGTNYVDGTVHQVGLGGSLSFRDPWDVLENPLLIELGGSLSILPSRTHQKIDPTDAVGTYRASGTVLVAGIALRYLFAEERLATPAAPVPTPAPEAPPPAPVPGRTEPTP